MPELPEVETIVNDLRKKILNEKIINIEVRLEKIVKNSKEEFVSILKNNSFKKITRRAKFLIFELAKGDYFLVIHLRMTGQLIYQKEKEIIAGGHSQEKDLLELPNKYSHVIFSFANNGKLFFNDLRQFAMAKIFTKETLNQYLSTYGIEPFDKNFSQDFLKKLLKNKKTNIKAFLLNQKYVVGIGNIYADEILFASLVNPKRNTSSLNDDEIKNLYNSIKKILQKAIKERGTTFNNYVDADGNKGGFLKFLKVYQKEGEFCQNCKQEKIKKIRLAGRGTSYCEKCQK